MAFNFDTIAYQEMLRSLFQRSRGLGMHFSLERMYRLLPRTPFPTIHIAGTNGKGSVATKVAHGLFLNGLKVGLYTSPHIRSICERVRIDGVPITPEKFLNAYQKVMTDHSIEEIGCTFFELVTLIGFLLFSEEKVDVAVIETGLGGRLDATNVITPLLSVITSIGLDHTAQLGQTIEEITHEKAGIIKEGIPVVIGPNVDERVIRDVCRQKNAPYYRVSSRFRQYDDENSAIALKVLTLLSSAKEVLQKAVQVRPACRFEKVAGHEIYLDVAHNPDGIERLVALLPSRFVVLFTASREKDCASMLRTLRADHFIFPKERPFERLASADELYQKACEVGIPEEKISIAETIEEAIFAIGIPYAHKNDMPLVITGSFFIMGKARRLLGYEEFDDPLFASEMGRP